MGLVSCQRLGYPADEVNMVSIRKLEPKTYDDYLALPDGLKAELIDGELLMSPQPKGRHVRAASFIGARLLVRFGDSADETAEGPGGWWIFDEPECHLALDRRVVIPDVAGWRREHMPRPPGDTHKFTGVPDWVCEVISPSTASRDFLVKMPRYREAGVQWLWLVYPAERRVDVFQNSGSERGQERGEEWVEVVSSEGPGRVRLPPFDAVELDTSTWWADSD